MADEHRDTDAGGTKNERHVNRGVGGHNKTLFITVAAAVIVLVLLLLFWPGETTAAPVQAAAVAAAAQPVTTLPNADLAA